MSEQKIGIYEAKSSFTSLVREAENGYAVTITRHGKPVARLVPIECDDDEKEQKRLAVIEELRTAFKGNFLDGMTIREMIDEGRR